MPIFVSRFSSERSLIGSFTASSSRRNGTTERGTSATQTSAASSSTSQSANRFERTRGLTSPVATSRNGSAQSGSARSASATNPESPASSGAFEGSSNVGSLTLLDQLRLRSNNTNPVQDTPSDSTTSPAASPPHSSVRSPEGSESSLGALAARLRALTAELSASRAGGPTSQPDPEAFDNLISENQSANAAADEENLRILIEALKDDGTATQATAPPPVKTEPALDVAAIATAITERAEAAPSRESQQQTLREGLSTIASGLRADAAIETRQNVEASARSASASADIQARQEMQQNQRDIHSLQSERRSAQQEARNADKAIRQLQIRSNRVQAESTKPANPGTSLDVLAQ
jgi:hypothetical protein